MSRRWLRLLPIVLIGALFVAVLASGVLRRLSLRGLAENREVLTHLVAAHPTLTLAAFVGLYVLLIVACMPGPSIMSMAGGMLFGPLVGGIATLTALVGGAAIVFLACRTAFGDWAAKHAGPTMARIEAGFSRDAFSYLLALRLMPVAPFFMVNFAAGLARVRLSAFFLATLIGAAPSAFIYAGLGAGLDGVIRRHERLDASLLARPDIAVPLLALTVLALAPPAWRYLRRGRRTS
ncbi:MAG TPA: TVP38/TMEM64 family protein [Caulobacteraceae bacterium]|jgi:uncharacterized membrane protein YdjX (TVP38/TMEM64 family)|nr:TVP38/TMEM64 family protein [Caulobacteraceae bacterium]